MSFRVCLFCVLYLRHLQRLQNLQNLDSPLNRRVQRRWEKISTRSVTGIRRACSHPQLLENERWRTWIKPMRVRFRLRPASCSTSAMPYSTKSFWQMPLYVIVELFFQPKETTLHNFPRESNPVPRDVHLAISLRIFCS